MNGNQEEYVCNDIVFFTERTHQPEIVEAVRKTGKNVSGYRDQELHYQVFSLVTREDECIGDNRSIEHVRDSRHDGTVNDVSRIFQVHQVFRKCEPERTCRSIEYVVKRFFQLARE